MESHGIALATVGPMARNAPDLAALLEATLDRAQALSDRPLGECRFLLLSGHPAAPTDSGIVEALDDAAALSAAGATVERASELLPDLAAQNAAYVPMLLMAMDPRAPQPDGAPPTLATWYRFLNLQAANRRAWDALFEHFDFVLAPPFVAPAFPRDDIDPFRRKLAIDGTEHDAMIGMGWPGVASFPGLPSTVLPIGQSGGLPVGMQVIGPAWRDRDCVAAAGRIARLLGD
jgi:amidase